MRVAHFDCFSGISGDMVLGALVDVGVPESLLREALASLDLPITLEIERVKRCGFATVKATVHAADQEDYRFLPDVDAILDRGAMSDAARNLAKTIFRKVALAESAAHGMPLEKVHFHEVGALDSIADIVGAAVGLTSLGVERFSSSSVPTGIGTVKCAHGIMPVPTPGTLELLRGVPLAKCEVRGELTTPTGVAILTSVVTAFTDAPAMTIDTTGSGCGTRDFDDRPNILRLWLGTATTTETQDTVWLLETNLDDCPGELIGYAIERLFASGVLDVYTTPIQMKKQRPGVMLSVMTDDLTRLAAEVILFNELGTFGLRRRRVERVKLVRHAGVVTTVYGAIAVKCGELAGQAIVTPEYEDCARVARQQNIPLREVYAAVTRAGIDAAGQRS